MTWITKSAKSESDIFAEAAENPRAALKKRTGQLQQMAEKIKAMAETSGWREVVRPFLEKHGDPARLFGKKPEEVAALSPKVEAYYRLLKLVDSMLRVSEQGVPRELQSLETGEDVDGDVGEDDPETD